MARIFGLAPTAARTLWVAGSPGCGKSALIGRVGEDLTGLGFDVDFYHSCLDPAAVEAISVQSLDLTLTCQGGAPAGSEAEHLAALAQHSLNAARCFHAEWKSHVTAALDIAGANRKTEELLEEILPGRRDEPGPVRRRFASAITAAGPWNYLETVVGRLPKRFIITGEPGSGKSTVVGRIVAAAQLKGYALDIYFCPFSPAKPEHLVLPDLGVAVVTSAWPHVYPAKPGDTVLNSAAFLDEAALARRREDIAAARRAFHQALDRAVTYLARALEAHRALYPAEVDWEKVEEQRRDLVRQCVHGTPAATPLPG